MVCLRSLVLPRPLPLLQEEYATRYGKVFREHMLKSGQKDGYLNQPFKKNEDFHLQEF